MLHIILGILKIFGILLGILLLLCLAVLLAVIFVPVRYRLTGNVHPKQYELLLRISWLLHVISVAVSADSSGSRSIIVRLFGIRLPVPRSKKDRKEERQEKRPKKKKGSQKASEKTEREEPTDFEAQERTEPADKETAKTTVRKTAETTAQETIEPADQEAVESTAHETAESFERRGPFEKMWFQCGRICDKIKQIFQAIRRLWQNIVRLKQRVMDLGRNVIALLRKPGELLEFVEEYEVREVFGSLVGHLVFLIGHYKPRRIQGYLRFGTGDPSTTGQLTGLIYILLPARADRFSVEPEFNEKIFEMEVDSSGHIRALHVLRVLWRGFRDKKLRKIISKLRKKGDS